MKRIELTDEDTRRMDGCIVLLGMSGGKDSAATALALQDAGIEFRCAFMDTGWEHPETYRYLEEVLRPRFPLVTLRPAKGFAELAEHKGMFPSRTRRFCTELLKMKPLADYIDSLDCEVVSVAGIRADESPRRARMPRWEMHRQMGCWAWRPILDWTEQDVIDIHNRHGLPPNPLYLAGARRVGCFPCIHSRKSELAWIARTHPERIDEIEALEHRVQEAARAREAAKGKELRHPPAMFQSPLKTTEGWPCVSIRTMAEWAVTSRGGRQFQLFEKQEPPGCMRWGLCDTGSGP